MWGIVGVKLPRLRGSSQPLGEIQLSSVRGVRSKREWSDQGQAQGGCGEGGLWGNLWNGQSGGLRESSPVLRKNRCPRSEGSGLRESGETKDRRAKKTQVPGRESVGGGHTVPYCESVVPPPPCRALSGTCVFLSWVSPLPLRPDPRDPGQRILLSAGE